MKTKTVIGGALAAALAIPASAPAHVTLQPKEVTAGGFTRLNVRVPNERDTKGTTKVRVQMPPGFLFVSYEPAPGWKVAIAKRKLATPVESHGDTITEEVGTVTFSGDGKTGIIRPGQFRDFGLSVGVPDKAPGTKLTFKALQSYQGGEVVRWIGAPDADEPAPQLTLTAATDAAAAAKPVAAEAQDGDDGGGDGLAIAALILGGLGLLAGGTALMVARRG